MDVIDPGHVYALECLDGEEDEIQLLQFVKREGPGYPGNVGHHSGVNIQEVLRVLIDRIKYLDNQIPHVSNQLALRLLRLAILALELRAAERHGREWVQTGHDEDIEYRPVCVKCGHIGCVGQCHGH
jgi:hypothetical protein